MAAVYVFLILVSGCVSGFDVITQESVRELTQQLKILQKSHLQLTHTVEELRKTVTDQQKTIDDQDIELKRLHIVTGQKHKRLDTNSSTPVAFSAYINHYMKNIAPGTVIPFEKVTTNEGNAFAGTTGIFTCPRSGLYLFVWNIMVDHAYGTQVYLAINGVKRRWSYTNSPSANYANAANHDIVRLEEGDKVWIANDRASGEVHPHHTTFSGVLLFQ